MNKDTVEFRTALRVLREAGYNYGSVTRQDIRWAVADADWQEFRKSLKGQSTKDKILELVQWFAKGWDLGDPEFERRWIQVTNYLNALKRGGQLV